jgi:hypothetical protein
MTVIMYLTGLSQSCVVNAASQPSLRVRMTRNLQLRGLGACTREAYLWAVRQLAAFYRPTPNQFNEEQLHKYFLRLKKHHTYSKSVRCPFEVWQRYYSRHKKSFFVRRPVRSFALTSAMESLRGTSSTLTLPVKFASGPLFGVRIPRRVHFAPSKMGSVSISLRDLTIASVLVLYFLK